MKTIVRNMVILGSLLVFAMQGMCVEEQDPVRGALLHALTSRSDKLGMRVVDANEDPSTWHGFLGTGTNTQSIVVGRLAFDRYLADLGMTNCLAMSLLDQQLVRVAVAQCEILAYTNSFESLKSIALNTNAVLRGMAARLAVKFAPLNDATTAFVENFVTNYTGYAIEERGTVCCYYANRFLEIDAKNVCQTALVHAATMFYRHRNVDVVGNSIVDDLLKKAVSGYEVSSNRLDFALSALARPECTEEDVHDFTVATNQLLSSGRPLRWINIEGTNE